MRRSPPTWSRRTRTAPPTVRRQRHDAPRLTGRTSEQAVHPVHVPARNVKRRVLLADRLLIGALQEAIDLAVGVVVQLNLPHTELIGSAVPRSLGYLIDGFLRQPQVLVEIHEPRHAVPPRHASRHYCAPVTGTLSTPRIPSRRRRVTPGGRHSTSTAHRLAMPRSGPAGDSTRAPPKPISLPSGSR